MHDIEQHVRVPRTRQSGVLLLHLVAATSLKLSLVAECKVSCAILIHHEELALCPISREFEYGG